MCIPQEHVSRQHAVITHQFGVFMINDLGSANGTFVNGEQISEEYPLAHGDQIKLYVPIVNFSAVVTEEDQAEAMKTGSLILAADPASRPR
ncbi:MAG: FHA domain-containing protein [Anaerolineae bacterium]|nr:FHA domain-containing protein [Anaerolineae bacterium]